MYSNLMGGSWNKVLVQPHLAARFCNEVHTACTTVARLLFIKYYLCIDNYCLYTEDRREGITVLRAISILHCVP